MTVDSRYGTLLTPDIKIFRQYFEELVTLLGIQVFYRAPRPDKHYTTYAEIESNYYEPIQVGVIFDQHPDQQTLKKIGWVSELSEGASIIHVPYDLPEIQQGALFFVPSGLDNAPARLFRVTKLKTSIVYPSSIVCEIVPEFEDTYNQQTLDYTRSDLFLLNEEEDCNQ